MDTVVVTLRIGTAEDLAAIRFTDPLMRADPDRAQLIEAALPRGECIVATEGDEVLGFAVLNYSFFNQGFVPLLVVAAANRRTGVVHDYFQRLNVAAPSPNCTFPPTAPTCRHSGCSRNADSSRVGELRTSI